MNDVSCDDHEKETSAQDDMNEMLKKWAEEHDVDTSQTNIDDADPVEGVCEICSVRTAAHRCFNCGKNVCIGCFWVMLGMCKECVSEEQLKKTKEHHF